MGYPSTAHAKVACKILTRIHHGDQGNSQRQQFSPSITG
jgi:hypothetical protein